MDIHYIGDSCISFQFSGEIGRNTSREILNIYRILKKSELLDHYSVYDLVPTYCSLSFFFKGPEFAGPETAEELLLLIECFLSEYRPETVSREFYTVNIPVVYNGADLESVAETLGFSVKDIVRKHSAPLYQVAMIGFKPYFPYLIGLDHDLVTSRLDSPRLKIPAGSVAIGGMQTGIYPEESPGGWNLIGMTNPALLRELKPGDYIRFRECLELC